MDLKKNASLIIALSLPVLMVVLVTASIYLPHLWAPEPQHDFVYALNNEAYRTGYYYVVSNGRIEQRETRLADDLEKNPDQTEARLFYHDVTSNTSRELSFEEAQQLSLDDRHVSPDGFEVQFGTEQGGIFPFIFAERDYNQLHLVGHNVSKELNIALSQHNYWGEFTFLGWVVK